MNFKFSLGFVMPEEFVLESARGGVESPDVDIQAVSKALLDLTTVAKKVQADILEDISVDLGPYFDFWFADSVAAASRLLNHEQEQVRYLAQCLIDQEKSVLQSREGFLLELKRLGIKQQPSGS